MTVAKSKIEWTESTWNPTTGCTKISEGCENCYAYKMALRLQKMRAVKYENGFDVRVHENCFNDPLEWKKPSVIFVNSMSDLFHEDIALEHIQKIFDVMNKASWHTFQILTKRADRLSKLASNLNWTNNIWMGVTVENTKTKDRIDYLRDIHAKIKFVSFEPLLDDVGEIDFRNIDWAIVGGESGHHARYIDEEWVLNIKTQCEKQKIMFYFKQWGGTNKKKTGRLLEGKTWDEMPALRAY